MAQGRAALGRHVKICRYCDEFGRLCPDAVRLFIVWRGKPPKDEYVLGGGAWLDGNPAERGAAAEPFPLPSASLVQAEFEL